MGGGGRGQRTKNSCCRVASFKPWAKLEFHAGLGHPPWEGGVRHQQTGLQKWGLGVSGGF